MMEDLPVFERVVLNSLLSVIYVLCGLACASIAIEAFENEHWFLCGFAGAGAVSFAEHFGCHMRKLFTMKPKRLENDHEKS